MSEIRDVCKKYLEFGYDLAVENLEDFETIVRLRADKEQSLKEITKEMDEANAKIEDDYELARK